MSSEKKEDIPVIRSYIYILINVIFVCFIIVTLLQGLSSFLEKKGIRSFSIGNSFITNVVFFAIVPSLYTYFRFFFKKSMEFYEAQYSKHALNKYIDKYMLLIIPFVLFMIGPALTVYLFGGIAFGHEIKGWLQ